jgi:hypothetical protein
MALRARRRCVAARQRESCQAVIKLGSLPLRRRVARLAILREAGSHVVRILGSLKVVQMAGHAGSI